MKKAEVDAAYNEIAGHVQAAIGKLSVVIGPKPEGQMSVHAYEAMRRMEDFMSRVGNCMALAMARTDEAIDAAAVKQGMGDLIQFPKVPEGEVKP